MAKAGNGGGKSRRTTVAEVLKAAATTAKPKPEVLHESSSLLPALLLGLLFLVSVLFILNHGAPPIAFRLDERVSSDVRARVGFAYKDPESLNKVREDVRNATPTIYVHDRLWDKGVVGNVILLVEAKEKSKTFEAFSKLLEDSRLLVSDIKLREGVWKVLSELRSDLRETISRPIIEKARALDSKGVLSKEQWEYERGRAEMLSGESATIELRDKTQIDKQGSIVAVEGLGPDFRVRGEDEVRRELTKFIRGRFGVGGDVLDSKDLSAALIKLVMIRIRPSLTLDRNLTKEARDKALANISMERVVRKKRKNDLLLRTGDEVGLREMLVLRAENSEYWFSQPPKVRLKRMGGLLLVVLVLLGVTACWIQRTDKNALQSLRQLAGITILALAVITIAKAAEEVDRPVHIVPVVFFGMVASLVFPVRTAAAVSVLIAGLSAIAMGRAFADGPVLVAGAMAACLAGSRPRHRLDLLKAALIAGIVSATAYAGWQLLELERGTGGFAALKGAGWALGAALAQGLVLAGALPLLEAALGTTTSISLLELCDQNHPLLKALFLNAPGSHQHSMIVGMLSESAAEAIECDPLLARAGSYYHDIGKIARPEYFVENASPGKNRHDRLGNSMSAMVLISHVRDGVEMAKEYRLPVNIREVIEQHHGNTLVEFFFRQAKEQGENPSENVYRYPGPRPRSKEAAIVLLADTVEAASRTLEEPSVARLKALVHDLASRKLLDGQFDESGLTLRELSAIEAAFTRILASMFHSRVAYPDAREPLPASSSAPVQTPVQTPAQNGDTRAREEG
jgi:cyclic-di-AMP phosphodiesterase PgpH